jgi:DNA repair protein RadD
MQLRDYQRESVNAMLQYWGDNGGHGLLVVPTGGGKSLIAAELIRQLVQDYDSRVLLATHVSELVTQNVAKLVELWPEAPYGIYHAGLGKRDGRAPICFAGIHSIHKAPEVVGPRDVLLIDEAHLLSHQDSGMYRALIRRMQDVTPEMRVCGLTATPYRMSSGRLDEDYGQHKALFDDVVYEITILELIQQGYLCNVLPYVSPGRIDTTGIKLSGGDFNQKQLQETIDRSDINIRVVQEIIRAGEQRSTWLVFASGVDHCMHLTELFRAQGIETEYVTGATPEEDRKSYFKRARAGTLKCLVGVNTLTTGVDIPNIDMIACVRPTKSRGLWTQMIGRGTRLSPDTGKANCLLLDFTDNSLTHGPIDMLDGSKVKGEVGKAPVRECPDCHLVHHASAKNCPGCGHAYPEGETKITAISRAAAVLSTQSEPLYYSVDTIKARRHTKPGKADSLRLDYVCGLRTISHWVPLEHETAYAMARKWWATHSGSGQPPTSVAEALERIDELRVPGRILVTKDNGYERVSAWDYSIPPGKYVAVEVEMPTRSYAGARLVTIGG